MKKGIFIKEERFTDKFVQRQILRERTENIPRLISDKVKKETIKVLNDTLNDVKIGKIINEEAVKMTIKNMIEEILQRNGCLINLMNMTKFDDYTFTHSVNVCILSLLIVASKNIKKEEMEEVGVGALLHDIGKVYIPDEILNKPMRLTKQDYEIIKKHPLSGYTILSKNKKIGNIPKRIVLEHHECYDGSGYPAGLKREQISDFSYIVSISDVYDALTSDRPYRKKFLPYDAMRIIISRSERAFKLETVRSFIQELSIYPVGSLVKLNTKEIGLVIKVNRKALIRPVIRLIVDPKGNFYKENIDIDLLKEKHKFIIGIIDEDKLPQA